MSVNACSIRSFLGIVCCACVSCMRTLRECPKVQTELKVRLVAETSARLIDQVLTGHVPGWIVESLHTGKRATIQIQTRLMTSSMESML